MYNNINTIKTKAAIKPAFSKPKSCEGCSLYEIGKGFAIPEGNGSIPLLIVGESLGWNEMVQGTPFRPDGQSGSLLERVFRRLRLDRKQFVLSYLCMCKPPVEAMKGTSYEVSAINHCLTTQLDEIVKKYKPKCILTLGDLPFRYLTGFTGRKQDVGQMRGYVLPCSRYADVKVVGSYDLLYVKRGNSKLIGLLMLDVFKAVKVARGELVEGRDYLLNPQSSDKIYYHTNPTEDDAMKFGKMIIDNPNLTVAYDIETDMSYKESEDELEDFGSQITQIQFSIAKGTGIAFPFVEPFINIARNILQTNNTKIGHNCFHKNTSVLMEDNTYKPIWEIVKGDRVKTVKDGKMVTREVIETLETKDDRRWLEVNVDGGYYRGTGRWRNSGVVCTEDHEWILEGNIRKQTKDLQQGDRIQLPRYGSDDLILGTLLGDGYCTENGYLKVGHSNKEWATIKAYHLQSSKLHFVEKSTDFNSNTKFWDLTTRVPNFWRDRIYDANRIKKWIEPSMRALAVYYGDDGCLAKGHNVTMSIHKFKEQIPTVMQWFADTFGECSLQNDGVAYLYKDTSIRFFKAIAEYLHPSMDYKLPERFRGRYNGWMEELVPQIGIITSVTTKDYTTKQQLELAKRKFCITVEDTHTFFTRMGLVANCYKFDNPILLANNFEIKGQLIDTLWASHHYQPDLPLGLQQVASWFGFPFAWKHLAGSDLGFYGVADVDSLHWIYEGLQKSMKKEGLWD